MNLVQWHITSQPPSDLCPNTMGSTFYHQGIHSFIGAYKVLAHIVKHSGTFLSALEEAVAGQVSADKVTWSEPLIEALNSTKEALSTAKVITLTQPDNFLWIVTNGAVKNNGLQAILYMTSGNSNPKLVGFFRTKLHKCQPTWMPCEIEALCIAAAIKHDSLFIVQSSKETSVFTDSKPCVRAYEKLYRGEFSTSIRMPTFLTPVSHFHVSVCHLKGDASLSSDFSCRNAAPCNQHNCLTCSFAAQVEDSIVQSISVHDVIKGNITLPFTAHSTWQSIQADDPDLRRTQAHLRQDTRPHGLKNPPKGPTASKV